MADRMRVTSFIGDTQTLEGPTGETADNYTRRLATSPRLLRRANKCLIRLASVEASARRGCGKNTDEHVGLTPRRSPWAYASTIAEWSACLRPAPAGVVVLEITVRDC